MYLHNLTTLEIPRTVMGHHTDNESVFAAISFSGEPEPLFLVETPQNDPPSTPSAG